MMVKQGVALTLAVLFAAAAPASAENLGTAGGVTYLKATGDVDPGLPGSGHVAVKCPGDKKTIGGGGSISGSPSLSYIASSTSTGSKWKVDAWHVTNAADTVTAWQTCVNADDVSHASSGHSAPDGFATATIVSCDTGTAAGGGLSLSGSQTDGYLRSTFPFDFDHDGKVSDGWRTDAFRYQGAPPGTARTDVFCHKGPKPHYESKTLAFTTSSADIKVPCGGSRVVTGGGVHVAGDSSHIASSKPYDDSDDGHVPDDGWKVTISVDSDQDIETFAICI